MRVRFGREEYLRTLQTGSGTHFLSPAIDGVRPQFTAAMGGSSRSCDCPPTCPLSKTVFDNRDYQETMSTFQKQELE
ncbi:hypothetical protein ACLOJK_011310 [Asimina triloba]